LTRIIIWNTHPYSFIWRRKTTVTVNSALSENLSLLPVSG
jgi:hypothetical protein